MTDTEHQQPGKDCGEASAFREKLALMLFTQVRSTMLVGLLTMCFAAAILHGSVDVIALSSWLLFGLFTQVARVPLLVNMARHPEAPLPVNGYTFFVALTGLGWGLLSILFWSSSLTLANQIVIVMFPMALSVAAVTSYCSSPKTYAAFTLPAQLPFIAITLGSGDTSIMPLAVPALLFLGGQFVLFRRFHEQISTSIRLQHHNEALVENLSRQNEDLSQARDEAEVASRAKSEFLTRVSHEFRTPINGILGPLQLINTSALDTRQVHLLNTVKESGDRLLRMVDDVVEVSSLEVTESGAQEVNFSLQSLLGDLMTRWKAVATTEHLSLEWSVDGGVPEAIIGDERGVERLLEHLLSNAIEFTESGGVTLHATIDTVESAEARLRITVSDTGVGIEPSQLDTIFNDFVQGSDSMKRQGSGTGLGLGLSIVRRLAASMGGSVSAVSDAGIGTTFLVMLPLKVSSAGKLRARVPAEAPAAVVKQAQKPRPKETNARVRDVAKESSKGPALRSGLKALVAEDNRVNQMVIEAMLDGLGCTVLVTENGAAALEALEHEAFDIIFMDCQMPIMDGFKATSAIRERGELVPIVAVTANALASDRDRCLSAGMNDFLSKPFASDSLEQMLVRWVGAGAVGVATR